MRRGRALRRCRSASCPRGPGRTGPPLPRTPASSLDWDNWRTPLLRRPRIRKGTQSSQPRPSSAMSKLCSLDVSSRFPSFGNASKPSRRRRSRGYSPCSVGQSRTLRLALASQRFEPTTDNRGDLPASLCLRVATPSHLISHPHANLRPMSRGQRCPSKGPPRTETPWRQTRSRGSSKPGRRGTSPIDEESQGYRSMRGPSSHVELGTAPRNVAVTGCDLRHRAGDDGGWSEAVSRALRPKSKKKARFG